MRIPIITLLTLALLGTSAAAAGDALYAGTTAKRGTVVVRVNAAKTRVDQLRLGWTDSCAPKRPKYTLLDKSDRLRIRDRRFSATRTYTERGSRRRVTIKTSGRVGTIVRGSFSVRVKQGKRTCRTGTVKFTARRVR